MAWTWVRPADRTLVQGRPLLDLGTGDGQTLAALTESTGLVVGVDRRAEVLRPGSVNAEAEALPFADGAFRTVLAGDLFHHLDDNQLAATLSEIARALAPGGRLVAWWYASPGRAAPDAPRFPRKFDAVAELAVGFTRRNELELEVTLEPSPPTVGLVAER